MSNEDIQLVLPAEIPFIHDLRRSGYELTRDVPLIGASTLILGDILQEHESCLRIEEVINRCQHNGRPYAGQRHLERLHLYWLTQPEIIPVECRKFRLFSVGTQWRLSCEDTSKLQLNHCLSYLRWENSNHYHHWFDSLPYDPEKANWEIGFERFEFRRGDKIVLMNEQ